MRVAGYISVLAVLKPVQHCRGRGDINAVESVIHYLERD
jgi:hypothetical protein